MRERQVQLTAAGSSASSGCRVMRCDSDSAYSLSSSGCAGRCRCAVAAVPLWTLSPWNRYLSPWTWLFLPADSELLRLACSR